MGTHGQPVAGEWRWSALLLLAAASLTPRSAVFHGVVTALVVWAGWLLLAWWAPLSIAVLAYLNGAQ